MTAARGNLETGFSAKGLNKKFDAIWKSQELVMLEWCGVDPSPLQREWDPQTKGARNFYGGTFLGVDILGSSSVGYYQPYESSSSCYAVGTGTYKDFSGSSSAGSACSAGKYQDQEGLPSCTECLPGQYQDVGGEIQCKQCPKGQHDANSFMSKYRDASTVCEDCECIYIQYIMYIQ
jgi:hypothetical protein